MLTTILWVKDTWSCFKQFPSNFTVISTLWITVSLRVNIFSDAAGVRILSSDKTFYWHPKILPTVPVNILKDLKSAWNIN